MDPFQSLAFELRLIILLFSDTYEHASALAQSSPAMFVTWTSKYELAARTFISRAIPDIDALLQDYMALVLFPNNNSAPMLREARVKEIETHLYWWGRRELPDPVKVRSTRAIQDLLNLHSSLELYANDFLGKATHDRVRQSYRFIPKWSHPDFSDGFSNRRLELAGLEWSNDLVTQLNADQRRRILRSFL